MADLGYVDADELGECSLGEFALVAHIVRDHPGILRRRGWRWLGLLALVVLVGECVESCAGEEGVEDS